MSAALRTFDREIAVAGESGVVLAVSGGRDSMTLLHAAAAGARDVVRAVATFDHATGAHATAAATLVEDTARALGFAVVRGRADSAGRSEAEWREARWRFLRASARDVGAAAVATAHTRDDQCETVVMRALRGSATRGLAGLRVPAAGIVRPLAGVRRSEIAAYASAHYIRWIDDPSNADPRHLRARVRTDLLPAMTRHTASIADRVVALADGAANHRAAVDAWVDQVCLVDRLACATGTERAIVNESLREEATTGPRVLVTALAEWETDALALFWPAFAARAGVRLDRRAIVRLVAYTPHAVARVRNGTVQPTQIPVAGVAAIRERHGLREPATSLRRAARRLAGVRANSRGQPRARMAVHGATR